jgi:glycosyltransferase involved in cell wall biosynthesis
MSNSNPPLSPPRVAVVIPAYNAAFTIERALDSVFAQTSPVYETLVIDDGSTDSTREIVGRYAPRVRLLTQANAGPAKARNLGVANSSAEFIAFLDADDAFLPTRMEEQLAQLTGNPQLVLCYSDLLVLHADGTTTVYEQPKTSDVGQLLRLGNPGIPPSAVLLRRSTFEQAGGFSERHKGCEDWELWFRMHQLGEFCVIRKPLTLYQASTTGLSSDADHMYRDFLPMLDDVLLSDKRGISRFLWRHRILSWQAHKAALTARARRAAGGGSREERNREVRYAFRSIFEWPSPFWYPHRYAALAVTLKNVQFAR